MVEVSLDLDFDVLFSDPAPLEALFQRFGCVNRRRRHSESDVYVSRALPPGSPVYSEDVVWRGLAALEPVDGEGEVGPRGTL